MKLTSYLSSGLSAGVKKLLLAIPVTLMLVSCNEQAPVSMTVYKPLILKKRVAINTPSRLHFMEGTYSGNLNFYPGYVNINFPGQYPIKFHFSSKMFVLKDQTYNDSFSLNSKQNGQPYDLVGNVNSVVTYSENEYTDVNSCYLYNTCYYTPYGSNCTPVYGVRQVRYVLKYIKRFANLELKEPGQMPQIAVMSVDFSDTKRQYTYEGPCR
jgi:hypothetical protein